MKRTTIKDLAQKMGVNVSTISRALKNHPDVSAEMKNAVAALAKQMNYVPNYMAIHLRKRESKTIGLVIPSISMFFFPSVIQGIQDVAYANGYHLLMLQSNESLQREIENIDICLQNGVDGLLLSVSSDTANHEHLEKLQTLGMPFVLFDKVVENDTLHQVIINDIAAAKNATEHLLQIGKRNIVGIFGNPNLNITKRRIDGFRQAFLTFDTPMRPDAVQYAHSTDETFRIVSTLCSHHPPDGIFVMSDEILAGTLPAIKRSGLEVPKDCAVVAISDGYLPTYLDPPVTFVRHSGYEVGQKAAEVLCTMLQGGQPLAPAPYFIPTSLQVQASSYVME